MNMKNAAGLAPPLFCLKTRHSLEQFFNLSMPRRFIRPDQA